MWPIVIAVVGIGDERAYLKGPDLAAGPDWDKLRSREFRGFFIITPPQKNRPRGNMSGDTCEVSGKILGDACGRQDRKSVV